MNAPKTLVFFALVLALWTAPVAGQQTGRQQLLFGSQTEANALGRAAYQKTIEAAASRGELLTSGPEFERIKQISDRLISAAPEIRQDSDSWAWEVSLVRSDQLNAFCLPGGKIVVSSGLLTRLTLNDDEVAAVLGHEISHALLEHGREKVSEQQAAKVAVGLLGLIAAIAGAKHRLDPNQVFDATTKVGVVGTELLVLRPHSRERELEADRYGAELAARAGFDAGGAVAFWEKMLRMSSGTVEFLSTHPASENRRDEVAKLAPNLSQRFASRRNNQRDSTLTTSVPAAPTSDQATAGSAMLQTVECQLPDGSVITVALLPCSRMRGVPR